MTTQANEVFQVVRSGNGTIGVYSFPFKIFNASDLEVTLIHTGDGMTDGTGVRTPLTLDTHYSVQGIARNDGGKITLIASSHAGIDSSGYLSGLYDIEIKREASYDQRLGVGRQEKVDRKQLEDALDKLTILIRQVRRERVDWEGEWSASKAPYHLGAFVFHDDGLWHSTENNNSDEPGATGVTSWENVLDTLTVDDVNALIATWARAGEEGTIPLDKLPAITLGNLDNVSNDVDAASDGQYLKRVGSNWLAVAIQDAGGFTQPEIEHIVGDRNSLAIMRGLFYALLRGQDFTHDGETISHIASIFPNATRAETGQILKWVKNTSSGRSGGIPLAPGGFQFEDPVESLGDLGDVNLGTPPADGQTLVFRGGEWVPGARSGGGGGAVSDLNDLGDVTVSGVSEGQVLRYNGSEWNAEPDMDWARYPNTQVHDGDLVPIGSPGASRDFYNGERRQLDVAATTNIPALFNPQTLTQLYLWGSPDANTGRLNTPGVALNFARGVTTPPAADAPFSAIILRDIYHNEDIPCALIVGRGGVGGFPALGRVILLVGESASGNSGGNMGVVTLTRSSPRPGNQRAEHNYQVAYTANIGQINGVAVGGYVFEGTTEYPLTGTASFLTPGAFRFWFKFPTTNIGGHESRRYSFQAVSISRRNTSITTHDASMKAIADNVDEQLGINHHLSQINAKDTDQDRLIQANREEADTNAAKLTQLIAEIKSGTETSGLTRFFESLGEVGTGETVSQQIALTTRDFTISGEPVPTVRERQVDITDGNFPQPIPFNDIDFGTNLTEWVLGLVNRTTARANVVLNFTEDGTTYNPSFTRTGHVPIIYKGGTPVVDNYGIFIRENTILLAANMEATFPDVRMTMTMAATWNVFRYLSNGDEVLADAVVEGRASFRLPGGSFDLHIRRGGVEMTLQALTDLRAGDVVLKSTPERRNFIPITALSVDGGQAIRYLSPPERGLSVTSSANRMNLNTPAALNARLRGRTAYGFAFSGATGHDHADSNANAWGAAYHFWYLLWARFLDRYIGFKSRRAGINVDPTLLFDYSAADGEKTWVIGPMSAVIRAEIERLYNSVTGSPVARVTAVASEIKAQFALHIPQPGLPSMAFTPESGDFDMTLAQLVPPTRRETYLRRAPVIPQDIFVLKNGSVGPSRPEQETGSTPSSLRFELNVDTEYLIILNTYIELLNSGTGGYGAARGRYLDNDGTVQTFLTARFGIGSKMSSGDAATPGRIARFRRSASQVRTTRPIGGTRFVVYFNLIGRGYQQVAADVTIIQLGNARVESAFPA